MKKIKISGLGLLFVFGIQLIALGQDANKDYPKLKPIVKVFGNYHFGINENSSETAFEITRAYLGYDVKMSEHFSFKTNLDVGNPENGSSYELTAYLKTAALKYHKEKFTIHAGLIGLKQFKEQEKNWGYRYIYKSFQDQHKFGASADLGVMLEYQLVENLVVDATVRNGEGYKKQQSDNTYNGSIGLTFKLGKSLILRGFYEYAAKEVSQSVYSGFIAYKLKDVLTIGAEYNFMQNYSFTDNKDMMGYSAYLTYLLNDKFQLFGRYDDLTSNTLEGDSEAWHIDKNGKAIIGGLQYKLEKNIKISTNLQYWSPNDAGADNEAFVFVSLEYKL